MAVPPMAGLLESEQLPTFVTDKTYKKHPIAGEVNWMFRPDATYRDAFDAVIAQYFGAPVDEMRVTNALSAKFDSVLSRKHDDWVVELEQRVSVHEAASSWWYAGLEHDEAGWFINDFSTLDEKEHLAILTRLIRYPVTR